MHKIILVAAVAAVSSLGALNRAPAPRASAGEVPVGWAPADSADSLWRQGRNAISDEDWRHAQQLFARIIDRYPKSAYVADSYYWEAFALSRRGGTDNVRDAVSLLEKQIDRYASASSVKNGDSKSLLTRLQGTLARGGDAGAAAEITTRAGASARADRERAASTRRSRGPRAAAGRHRQAARARMTMTAWRR